MKETAMEPTELDRASADGVGLAFWRAFAGTELFLLLTEEPKGADLRPQVFDVTDGRLVLVFDREDRMAGFAPVAVPYAALPGRVVAGLAAGQGLSVGVNLGSGAVSETVLPPEALDWLLEVLQAAPVDIAEGTPLSVAAPRLDAAGLSAIEAVLAAAGMAHEALLAQVAWADGRQGTLLAFPGVDAPDQPALAKAVAEALALSGLDAAALDLAFPAPDSPLAESLRRAGRRYLPQAPAAAALPARSGPGMDKTRPPILK
jgi:hypothetical protein